MSNIEQAVRDAPESPEATGPAAGAASLVAAALLTACGGGGGGDAGAANNGPNAGLTPGNYRYTAPANDQDAARFLLQAQFSASDAEIAAVRSQGYAPWLATQLSASGQTGVQWLDGRGYNAVDGNTYFDQTYPGDFMIWQQLMKSPDAVRKRLALAMSELFVVSLSGIDTEWRSYAIAQYWDVLVQGTQSTFRALLEDITLNPAMGLFLNTKGNQKENSAGRQPDENYAREVMQLFTIGLEQLNPDGTPKLGADGQPIPTYAQADVSNLARVFTGWDLDESQSVGTPYGGNRTIRGTSRLTRRMVLNPSRHSLLAATFLGTTVPAGTDGATALRIALDALGNHPNVAPFFARQMIQRLVTSNPSPAYVARVAAAFNDDGKGVRGNLKSVFAAVLLDDEARGPGGLTDPSFGKLREPMLRFVQWGRTFGLESARGSWKLDDQSNTSYALGQSPLRAPSVFNYFRPGYVPPSTAMAANHQVAPEFQLANESTVGAYLNYMQDRIRNGFRVDSPEVPQHTYSSYVKDIYASYANELPLATDAAALVRRLNLLLTAGQLNANTQNQMVNALNATAVTASSADSARLDRICAGVLMVIASGEYLVQK
ncbi:MAG: hypothetical protein OJF60_000536 [Burkholderiaceae bacterium]|jgi:uncharacterized protein (DUF1800 family)|nr:MAG: hypothetical protein OJF60_000536 [Burkholderiaceae bacterium]